MHLKRIDIVGFKSFANKTTIYFSDGVTSIVGPNGCGKTNVLDALRWVLGEQKVTLLRGSKMEEVIFNGSRDMKPLGMAEVTLTLINDRGVLPTEYSEVQITRRLFRSGESEYLLNKIPCRLKDITELFYDTGMGAHSYSVIQQDMIEAVISDKAEERRFLFEEASGITKYKQRKRAALRKLEATENDFLRLNDIHSEVKTQVNSLKRQYKKAERYQKITVDIKGWELYLAREKVRALDFEKRELQGKLDELGNRIIGKETELDRVSAALETDRKEQIDLEHQLTAVGNQAYDISEKAHSVENEISILREKRANARSLIERNQDEIKALEARSTLLFEQIDQSQGELKSQKETTEGTNADLDDANLKQADADERLLAARSAKDQENQKLVSLQGRISSGRTEEENLTRQQTELNQLDERYTGQIAEYKKLLEEKKTNLDSMELALTDADKMRIDLIGKLDTANSSIEDEIEKSNELSLEISSVKASLEASLARKSLLEDMILHYEGHESGVVAAMENKERWPGIDGTVAELFVPKEGLEIAVEAALGELARFVVCDNRATAEGIIGFLRSEAKGKIGILVPDTGTINPISRRPEIDLPEFLGWLDSFVTTDEKLVPLMEAVLSRIAVFEEGHDPSALLERLPYGFKAVSTSGTVYGKNLITGGSDDKFPLFRRQEKVAEQEKAAETFRAELERLQTDKSHNSAAIAELRALATTLNSDVETSAEELVDIQKSHNDAAYQVQTTESDIARLEKERRATSDKHEVLKHNQYSLGLDANQLTDEKNLLMTAISSSGAALERLEADVATTQEMVSGLQVRAVEARSQIDQTDSKIRHLGELRSELLNTLEIKKTEITQAREEIESSGERVTVLEATLKGAFDERTQITGHQSQLRATQTELLDRVGEKDETLKKARSEKESLSEESHRLEIKLTSIESETVVSVERIREEYELDIRMVEAASPDPEFPAAEAGDLLFQLKEKLKKFGAVNLLALEEYETSFEREKFLGEQLDDLNTAKKDLKETIIRINQTAKALFEETFVKVQKNFRELFVELFNGGEAAITLEDPNDPLESNINVNARPKGKKLISITMMSGGERALTAIALLFSLYKVKPSPFCILDEIDAPLDDANCRRFLKIIGTFSSQTQFITITHNKITMEAANNLYGITMEQPGISKLVAVKFHDAGEDTKTAEEMIDTSAPAHDFEEDTLEPVATGGSNGDSSSPPTPTEAPAIGISGVETDSEEIVIPEPVIDRISPEVLAPIDEEGEKQ